MVISLGPQCQMLCCSINLMQFYLLSTQLGDEGVLLHIDLARGKRRLGGSALAQVYDQV